MTVLIVGDGKQYPTMSAAVAVSRSGDVINVDAGTYTNDVLNISHSLTLHAVGGTVKLVGTAQPANGKGLIDAGGAGVNVAITGFDISGAAVPDKNGAGIRYEGGTLTLSNVSVHDNQNGILANPDADGSITIANSTFADNGIGDGQTHNIYVGAIGNLTVKDSTITGARVGHDIKSRAARTTIIGNTITDGASGTASYEIDLTNGGVGTIENNLIEKGARAENPIAVTFGEEGGVYANSSLTVRNNTITTSYAAHNSTAVVNRTDAPASISGNQLHGWMTVASGPASVSGNAILASEPAAKSAAPAPATPGASSDAAITPDTATAGSAAPAFVADAPASAPESPAGDPAPPAAPDMAGDILASYADAAVPLAATSWTGAPVQDGATDLAAHWGSRYPAHDGALPATDAAGQAAAGTTGDPRAWHS